VSFGESTLERFGLNLDVDTDEQRRVSVEGLRVLPASARYTARVVGDAGRAETLSTFPFRRGPSRGHAT